MNRPEGFTFQRRGDDVLVSHRGKPATTLRDTSAAEFLREVDGADELAQQELMARVTGNYRRGNERRAKQHPRNR